MMWKAYRHAGSEEDYIIYKEALNQAIAEIGNSKRSYEQKLVFNIKHGSKSFYAYMFEVNRKFRIRSVYEFAFMRIKMRTRH